MLEGRPISTQFLLTSLVVVLIPGTGVLYTVSIGLSRDRRSAIAAALGCTLGIVPHLVASALGLSAIMHLGAEVFTIFKYVGSAYLLYLAWQMWKETGALAVAADDARPAGIRVVARGVVLNLLNPKLTVFFLAFLPQFITPGAGSSVQQLLLLSAVFMLMTFCVFCGYGILANRARSFLMGAPKAVRWIQRSFALVFAGLAVELALSDR